MNKIHKNATLDRFLSLSQLGFYVRNHETKRDLNYNILFYRLGSGVLRVIGFVGSGIGL